jgi:putative salt-induced outer membrane protein YdiY
MNIQSDKWQVAGGKRPKAGASLAARHLPLATLILWGVVLVARADVLIGTNGDRFTGKVVEETAESVVFDAELGGRLTIPRARIREIQRPVPPLTDNRSLITSSTSPLNPEPSTLNPQPSTNLSWLPPAIGHDKEDWIQLKSGEWLRGRLYYIQQRKVEFASDELDDFSLDLKDVRQVYPANPLFTKFNGRGQIFGQVVVSNEVVEVFGPEQVTLSRDQLTGITPGGEREFDFWSGNLSVGLSLQSGNSRQKTLTTSAEVARRTPATTLQLNYLGNYSEAEGVQNANNHRINGLYDIRLNRDWFLRPAYLEYYRDQVANIAHKGTFGVGLGYYIFDREGLQWLVAGGPGYQYTRFENVEPGQADTTSTLAAVLQTSFKADITRRLKFIETIGVTLTSEEAGLYSHHAVSTLELEIKRHLDLNVSFVWDYLQNPQIELSGTVPQHSDFRLVVGVGLKF